MKRLAFALVFVAACDKSTEQPQTQSPSAESEGLPPGNSGPEASLTAAACQAQGGNVIGDIGNGAIFEPDYTGAGTHSFNPDTVLGDYLAIRDYLRVEDSLSAEDSLPAEDALPVEGSLQAESSLRVKDPRG